MLARMSGTVLVLQAAAKRTSVDAFRMPTDTYRINVAYSCLVDIALVIWWRQAHGCLFSLGHSNQRSYSHPIIGS